MSLCAEYPNPLLDSLINILIAEVMDSRIIRSIVCGRVCDVDIAEGRPRLLISNSLIRVAGPDRVSNHVNGALYTHTYCYVLCRLCNAFSTVFPCSAALERFQTRSIFPSGPIMKVARVMPILLRP